ncbi:MAG TPA: GntR family transcriptional regulator [Rectinemataceae bacterium]|nr:GntR family transcriptional regulator [Rectinemataceae bacterium]
MMKNSGIIGLGARNDKRKSLTDEVYDALLKKFVDKELVPGQVLNRRSVAKELNVSVAPVLEAFLYLEMEGYVETLPRKGTIVKPIRKQDIYEQLIMREAIECQAAYMYAGKPLSDNLDSLLPLAALIDGTDPDAMDHWEAEIAFHGALISLSRCDTMVDTFFRIIRLGTFYNMNRLSTDISPPIADRVNQSHCELLDRLVGKDAETVVGYIRDHVRSGKERLFAEFDQRR